MAVKINATKLFKHQVLITGIDYSEWIVEFSDWKSGSPDSSYLFGRDFKNTNSNLLYHVHVIPESENDPIVLKNWKYNYKNNSSAHKRTSDHLIFYTYSETYGYLLISIVSPHGHAAFANKVLMEKFEKIAENFIVSGDNS